MLLTIRKTKNGVLNLAKSWLYLGKFVNGSKNLSQDGSKQKVKQKMTRSNRK